MMALRGGFDCGCGLDPGAVGVARTVGLQLGEWVVNDRSDLLAAYRGPVSSNLPPEDQLEEDYYLGLLIRL